ncbi:MAG: glycosyltransferase family 39 protein [Caldilineaceae bacterium]
MRCVVAALYQGNTVTDLPGIYDQISYHGLAMRVADGHGFSFAEGHWPATPGGEPTAHWSYLYTLYLAGVYSIFGVQPWVARLIQAVVAGILHTWLAYRIGRRVFGVATGLTSAAFTAGYLYFVYYAGGLLTETFYFVCILWTLDVALRIVASQDWLDQGQLRRGQSRRGASGSNLVWPLAAPCFCARSFSSSCLSCFCGCGGTCLSQPLRHRARRLRAPALQGLLEATLVLFLLIVPWTIRNYRAFSCVRAAQHKCGLCVLLGESSHPRHPFYAPVAA